MNSNSVIHQAVELFKEVAFLRTIFLELTGQFQLLFNREPEYKHKQSPFVSQSITLSRELDFCSYQVETYLTCLV